MKLQEENRDRVDSVHLQGEGHSSFPTIPQILSTKDQQVSVNVARIDPENPFVSADDDEDSDDEDDYVPVHTLAHSKSVRPKTLAQIDLVDGKTKACDREATFDSFVTHDKLAATAQDKSLSHNSQMLRGLKKIFGLGRRKKQR